MSKRYIKMENINEYSPDDAFFALSADQFMDEARKQHPELSDDNLIMIYRLGLDEWSRYGHEGAHNENANILNVLACMSRQMLEDIQGVPIVHFDDLFRWREITQIIGEDLLTCAFLAFNDRNSDNRDRGFDWPTVIHNDNPHLNYLFREKGLCELHSHLRASTNVFEINWVCIMNHLSVARIGLNKLAAQHRPSDSNGFSDFLEHVLLEAAAIRWTIYRYLKYGKLDMCHIPAAKLQIKQDEDRIDYFTKLERERNSTDWIPDYMYPIHNSPMAVFVGERWMLYNALKLIYRRNEGQLSKMVYGYVLRKNILRGFIVQINKNLGFSNFQRFQRNKDSFLTEEYSRLLYSLPFWEAKQHNFTHVFETRIGPPKNQDRLMEQCREIIRWNGGEFDNAIVRSDDDEYKWTIIFHFLKRRDKKYDDSLRNSIVRKETKKKSPLLSSMPSLLHGAGIDAASSEFDTRPEAYSQGFRFLRYFGLNLTFHAGEDFYDIADGLRSIDEAINLLQLRATDRLGHALALGIDSGKYYDNRHNTIALPKQWMLDNVVWLYMKSKEFGVDIDRQTESFLHEKYRMLCREIGYAVETLKGKVKYELNVPDIQDYWESMYLRGDDPSMYDDKGNVSVKSGVAPDMWEYYSLLDSRKANFVRNSNKIACRLYRQYHTDIELRREGEKVREFRIPPGYVAMISDLQNAMIKDICKRQLCIECCPSSNVKIGKLEKFESHPIFRFMPINPNQTRYPLAVTVNTDDLGVFATSLPNEFSLLALALLKIKKRDGGNMFSPQEVYDWISRVIDNGYKFTFIKDVNRMNNNGSSELNQYNSK